MFNERRGANRKGPERDQIATGSGAGYGSRAGANGGRERDSRLTNSRPQRPSAPMRYQNERNNRNNGFDRNNRNNGYRNRSNDDKFIPKKRPYQQDNRNFHNKRMNIPVIPLEEMKPNPSLWNKIPAGLEGMSAKFAKSSGVFSSPSQNLLQNLSKESIEELIKKQNNMKKLQQIRRVEQRLQSTLDSKFSKKVILKGVDFDKISPKTVQSFLEGFLTSTVIPNVLYEELLLKIFVDSESNSMIIDCVTSLVATTLMSFNNKHIEELDSTLLITRPNEYIEFRKQQQQVENDEIIEEIIQSSKLCCVNNLPLDMDNSKLKELLSKYGELNSMVILMNKLTYDSIDVAFFDFKGLEKNVIDEKLKEISKNEGLNCFFVCENSNNNYHQDIELTVSNVKELADSRTTNISRHEITSTIQLLNCISLNDVLDNDKYRQVYEAIKNDISTMNGFENLVLVRPPEGFRIQIDDVAPEYGRIYVKFKTPKDAKACLTKICGRYFHSRVVLGGYVDDFDHSSIFT